jgi:NAD(P)-dependent dehydrogenase (short-subunit alcohol dehydrogenase family)
VPGGMCGIGGSMIRCGFDSVNRDRTIVGDLTTRAAPGSRVSFACGDLADLGDHSRQVDASANGFGRIDCLVKIADVPVRPRVVGAAPNDGSRKLASPICWRLGLCR